jgi:hypothetical protein
MAWGKVLVIVSKRIAPPPPGKHEIRDMAPGNSGMDKSGTLNLRISQERCHPFFHCPVPESWRQHSWFSWNALDIATEVEKKASFVKINAPLIVFMQRSGAGNSYYTGKLFLQVGIGDRHRTSYF